MLCAAPGAAAAINLTDAEGRTPLDCARSGYACAALLRAHGAS